MTIRDACFTESGRNAEKADALKGAQVQTEQGRGVVLNVGALMTKVRLIGSGMEILTGSDAEVIAWQQR